MGELYLAQIGFDPDFTLIPCFCTPKLSYFNYSLYNFYDHPPLYLIENIVLSGIFFNITLLSNGFGKVSRVHF